MTTTPTQVRTIDPFEDFNSSPVNRFSQMVSNNEDGILNSNPIVISQLNTTNIRASAGHCFKDNVLISIDQTDIDIETSLAYDLDYISTFTYSSSNSVDYSGEYSEQLFFDSTTNLLFESRRIGAGETASSLNTYQMVDGVITKISTQLPSSYIYGFCVDTTNQKVYYGTGDGLVVASYSRSGVMSSASTTYNYDNGQVTGCPTFDGTYIYAIQTTDNIISYQLDSNDQPIEITNNSYTPTFYNLKNDGSYIYVASVAGLRAYAIDGDGSLTFTASHNASDSFIDVEINDSYIFTLNTTANELRVYTFDGSFSLKDTIADSSSSRIYASDNHVFLSDPNGTSYYSIEADGTIALQSNIDSTLNAQSVAVDKANNYLYHATYDTGIRTHTYTTTNIDTTSYHDEDGYHYCVLEYQFAVSNPGPSAKLILLSPTQVATEYSSSKHLILKVLEISSGTIDALYDYDPDNPDSIFVNSVSLLNDRNATIAESNYNISVFDKIIYANTAVVYLHPATARVKHTIVNVRTSGAVSIYVCDDTSDTIDDVSSIIINNQYNNVTLVPNGVDTWVEI